MGCGNSKLNPEGEVVPPRIRPLLRRRFLELRKRRNGSNLRDGTLSKKELLKDSEFEEENSLLVDSKSIYSPEGSTKSSIIAEEPKEDKDIDSTTILVSNNGTRDSDESKQNLEEAQHLRDLKTGKNELPDLDEFKDNESCIKSQDINKEDNNERNDKKVDEEKDKDEEDEDNEGAAAEEEEGRADNEGDGCICPGSPSFRVYFVEAMKIDKENIETTDAGKQDVSHQKSRSHESVESISSANLSGDQENKMIKKGKKGRSFKRAISKRRPAAVKNLLNVKSCYHIGCAGHGNDRASLLARKAEA